MTKDHEQYADPNYRYSGRGTFERGHAQDPERCRWQVADYSLRWPNYHQCNRKPKVDGLWCLQHSPDEMAKREKAKRDKWDADWQKRLVEIRGRYYREALLEIAKGELNDPVGYAVMKLEEIEHD